MSENRDAADAEAITRLGIEPWKLQRCVSCFGEACQDVIIKHSTTGVIYREPWCEFCWMWALGVFDRAGKMKLPPGHPWLNKPNGETVH